ncbi:hypothetical protein Halru_1087 [Halovivax ruber XH-70]|uniref:Uncharacterized protein n=1 Tax=Halovivax ruber (strain DSM 18193 / JCM 13892 / XH-70) TaxID=797302 RepID=L0IAE1_HALRX|nr:hypothetical protein [Halovivax ruber]AGB15704.1 hypothetical protein Halru_1087 [Halovivax ruber XH-70]
MSENQPADPHSERVKDATAAETEAWKQELEEMEQIAQERRDDGWEVLTMSAGHTNTVSRDGDADEQFGICHIVPDSDADAFAEFYDEESFTEYLVYGRPIEAYLYLVTELIDPVNERAVLIAGRYNRMYADGMISDANEEGVLYTHVQKINGTVVGSFEHETYGPLIGEPEEPGVAE